MWKPTFHALCTLLHSAPFRHLFGQNLLRQSLTHRTGTSCDGNRCYGRCVVAARRHRNRTAAEQSIHRKRETSNYILHTLLSITLYITLYTLHYTYITLHVCVCTYCACTYCVHINPYLYHSVSRSTIYPQSSLLNNCHGRLSHAQPLYWKIWAEEDMTWRMPCHDTRQALWPGAHADAIGSHEDRSSPSLDMGFLPSLPPKNLLRQSERTCFGTSKMYDKGC